MVYGEGIRQEQGNIAETPDVVTKDVVRLRLFVRNNWVFAGNNKQLKH